MISPELLQHIAIARLILGGSIITLIALIFISRRVQNKTTLWAIALGITWAVGAATLILPSHTLLWGNQGDETFQIAFMQRVIAGEPFSDFFYKDLAPFYPPLYFWVFGTIGRVMNWDGIAAA